MLATDFFELVRARRSIRAYEPRSLDERQLHKILEATRVAPSAGNLQAYEVVVVEKPERREELRRAAFGHAFVAEAPVVLVFVTDPARSTAKYGERAELYSVQDAAIAASYAQLAATALGLGSVWIGAFEGAAVLKAIGASPPHRAVSLLVIGYSKERPEASPRRALSDLVRRETFAEKWSR
jgi:nitroreductase